LINFFQCINGAEKLADLILRYRVLLVIMTAGLLNFAKCGKGDRMGIEKFEKY